MASESPSFERDVKPLFREQDRNAMSWAFDLWSYTDVSAHADDILKALSAGVMPCDGRWDPDRVELFRSWADGKKAT